MFIALTSFICIAVKVIKRSETFNLPDEQSDVYTAHPEESYYLNL